MSMTDLVAPNPAVIPAVEAKEYPLKYARLILLQGTPQAMRAYVELQPYRRIMGEVPVEITPAQPILDAEGNPVLDDAGNPTYTPAVMGTQTVVVAEELKSPEVQGDITVLEVPNILPANVTAESAALVEQTIGQYLAAGGDLQALVMAGIVVIINQLGKQTGALKAE